jgi:hypothetical protein
MTTRPHDALFKSAFQDPQNAAALARCNLPSSLASLIHWSTMRLVPGSFVDERLRDRHTDLLFEVDAEFGDLFVYLLFEHLSFNPSRMPLRVCFYMDRIWERFDRLHPRGPLPPIIPLVICHAPEGWTAARTFHELFSPMWFERAPELASLVPSFGLLIDDLQRASDDDLGSRALAAFAKVALWLLRDGRAMRRLIDSMSAWVGLLDDLPQTTNGHTALESIVTYLATVANDQMIWDAFHANLEEHAPGAKGDVMTLAEQWFNQGQTKGEAKGRLEGRVETLIKQLTIKFGELGEHHRARLATATITELDAWTERVLFATSLEQLFGE